MDKHYAGDVGLCVVVDCGRDVSRAVAPSLKVRRPDGSIVNWKAQPYEQDGRVCFLRYVTRPGDLSLPGVYRLQACLTLGEWSGLGAAARFFLRRPFD